MAILKGFPPSNTITPDAWMSKPHWDRDKPTKEQIEALKAYYYSPSPIKVKWKEIINKAKE